MADWERSSGFKDWPGCLGCAYRHWQGKRFCPAYPNGIPFPIASGQVDHLVPRPGQVGEIVYEPLDWEWWRKTGERRVLVDEPEPAKRP
jgi:hypothetical protein